MVPLTTGTGKKKSLKKSKKSKVVAGTNTEDLPGGEGVPNVEDVMDNPKDLKKKKKKKNKQPFDNVDNGMVVVSADDAKAVENGSETPRKRKRKDVEGRRAAEAPAKKLKGGGKKGNTNKRNNPTDEDDSVTVLHSAVGDRGLAESKPAIVKASYVEHDNVASMSAQESEAWLKERQVEVEGLKTLKPFRKFEETCLGADMLYATRDFAQPSPIQAVSWPVVLRGRDFIGIAATGSGKTLAFGLPALAHIAAQRKAKLVKRGRPVVLALAPTRELALQIAEVLEEAGSRCGISTLCAYGGVPRQEQIQALKKGVDIVVGTPGRLEDLINDGACGVDCMSYVVLDEADRMLDLGFEPHIRTIVGGTRSDRQTLMFSATWPMAIRKLAAEFLQAPVRVTIGSRDLSASHSITQTVEVIELERRMARLLELLRRYHSSRRNRVLVFVLYKKEAPRVEAMLRGKGWNVAAIHGDVSQVQRTRAVEQFKDGSIPVLIATDVAARGLDIPDVEVVINYSFPLTTEDYVHRIGRTGRAGKTGLSHTFFCSASDKPRAGELVNVLREAGQKVPPELLAFGTHVKKKESKMYGAHFKDVDMTKKATKITFDSDDDD